MFNISHGIRYLIFWITILPAVWLAPAVFAETGDPAADNNSKPVRVEWIEIHADSTGTHLRVPFTGAPSTLRLDNPPRWAVDIKPARQGLGKTIALWTSVVDLGAIKTLRVGQFRLGPEPVVRLTLVLSEPRELTVDSDGLELLLRLEPKPGDPWGGRRFGKDGDEGSPMISAESQEQAVKQDPDTSKTPASAKQTPIISAAESSTESQAASKNPVIARPVGQPEITKIPVAPPDALPHMVRQSLPKNVEPVRPSEPDSAALAASEAKRYVMTGGEVTRHATGYLLEKSQEALLQNRPDQAMDMISRGLRLYKGTQGTNALRLLWHLAVPLTSRPAAVAMFEEEDATEAHLIAVETYFHLMQIALTLQNGSVARRILETWEKAHKPDEPWIDSVLDYTRMSLSRGRWDESLAWLERLPADVMDPRQAQEEQLLRSEALEGLGRFDEAEKILNDIVEDDSGELMGEARLRRADLFCIRGDYIGALPLYTEAIDKVTDPDQRVWAIYRTGVCREEAGNLEGARESFLQLLKESPQSHWTQYARRHVELLSMALTADAVTQ
ncbi:MAG: tetratricopeptide repeat protein [Candidatus Eisenbacteria bacterium]|uniref:Tetratricopeptide repeat protein n=1 Tax=Eiseniibacteriota bacterium TaxID=2212470 RepID=A0A948RYA3_UNCEI|nr:tetratricopeptide repeat protein [Candidatus Eisenbacteria bacterium]MBU1950936.1 tetratricopeptide repeat protein [Candidatus Eisenbacteria bacterium]MBU2692191.1 tetratricopeptide repeat protein [Candidatus Eisenbacteria bacterium]